MLVIRMQRTGRTGHAQFRVIAQDKRFSPTSGRVSVFLGSYNPHTKEAQLEKDKIENLLKNGAQPSGRVAKLLKDEGIKLPAWAAKPAKKSGKVRNPDKRRSTRPAEPAAETPPAAPPAEAAEPAETPAAVEEEIPAAEETKQPAAEPEAEPPKETTEVPAEEPAAEPETEKTQPEAEEKTA